MFNFKTFIATLALCLTLTATVKADVLVQTIAADGMSVTGVSFDVNPALGRAWINIGLNDSYASGEDSGQSEVRAKVAGLSYDAATGAIIFQEAGVAPVVCAVVKKNSFIGIKWSSIKSKGICGVTRISSSVKVTDDGYETKETKYMNIYFGKLVEGRKGE